MLSCATGKITKMNMTCIHRVHNVWLVLALLLAVSSCEIFKNDIPETDNFQQIYTLNNGDAALYPLDVAELPDNEGFLILSALSDSLANVYPRVHLLKLNAAGNPDWQLEVDPSYYGPARKIAKINGDLFIFCMKANQQACALKVNVEAGSIAEFADYDIQIPLHVSVVNNNEVLITSYNRFGNQTDVLKLNELLQPQWKQSFPVGTDEDIMEVNIFNYIRQQKNYAFFSESVSFGGEELYVVNCFSNYTLSMHYLNASDGKISGKINGYQLTGFVTAAQQVSDTALFLSFVHTDKYYVPAIKTPETKTFLNIDNLTGTYFPEIKAEKAIDALRYPTNETPEKLVMGINNGSGNPELFVFTAPEYKLGQIIPVDQHYPSEIRRVIKTADNGLLVLMQIQYANYLPRISLVKLPSKVF